MLLSRTYSYGNEFLRRHSQSYMATAAAIHTQREFSLPLCGIYTHEEPVLSDIRMELNTFKEIPLNFLFFDN